MWVRLMLGLAGALFASTSLAEERFSFEWQGAGGYTLRGGFSYHLEEVSGAFVRERDLTCFFVDGEQDGTAIGHWGLTMLNEETDWRLFFDPETPELLVEGMGVDMPQAWNMDGFGTSCGPGGFGFNIGNAAQDLCLDGKLIVESQVSPFQPFPVRRDPDLQMPSYACHGPALMSLLAD